VKEGRARRRGEDQEPHASKTEACGVRQSSGKDSDALPTCVNAEIVDNPWTIIY